MQEGSFRHSKECTYISLTVGEKQFSKGVVEDLTFNNKKEQGRGAQPGLLFFFALSHVFSIRS